jgi:hypothetical protein
LSSTTISTGIVIAFPFASMSPDSRRVLLDCGVNGTRPGRRPSHRLARHPHLEPPARPGEPEIAGDFASMGIDPGQVFEAQLATLTA